jgi:hypothetical protein
MSDEPHADRLFRIEREFDELKASLQRRFEELAVLTRLLKQREWELETTGAELERERAELARLRNSPYWRATEPIRNFAQRRQLRRDVRAVQRSRLFDPGWYRRTYPDVVQDGMDPALHYVIHGAAEGRDPGPGFDTRDYLRRHPEVARDGLNPLVHFLRHGGKAGPAAGDEPGPRS